MKCGALLFSGVVMLSLFVAGCQKEKKRNPPAAAAACAADMSLNLTAPVKKDILKLSRVFAVYRHTSCDGKVTTRRKNAKDPKDAYSLQAQTLQAGQGEYEVSAYNRTTCDTATIKPRQPGETRMEIQFHTSKGTRRTHAKKNADNYIDYEFRRCLKRDELNKCISSEVAERGTVVLFVEYAELDDPVVRETKETCAPTQNPVP